MSADPERLADQNPSDLERNGEAIREDMNRTLNEIERKLSPGELLDRSLGYLREHGGGIVDKVGETVRQNPLPVLMTATGLLWMVTSTYRSARSTGGRSTGYETRDRTSAPNYTAASSATENAGSEARSTIAAAGERVRNAEQAVVGRARATKAAATDMARHALDSTRQQKQRAQQGFRQMVDEQPMALGAIGVAVGAILGAALPMTEWENRALGQARSRALSKAKELGEQTYDEVRETVRGSAGSNPMRQNGNDRQGFDQQAGRA